jgi:AcrR family transcriptional regulator
MDAPSKTDRRRAAGQLTRQRLLDATRVLLAERGEDAVTLREITVAANANVAAVSYHFGSLGALCRATMEQAFANLIGGQIERLRALGEHPTVEQIAFALAQSVIQALTSPDPAERAFLRIMARTLADPPDDPDDWTTSIRARADAELLPRLSRALPGLSDEELRLRAESAIGIVHFLASGNMRLALECKTPVELERLLVPVIAGALGAAASTGDYDDSLRLPIPSEPSPEAASGSDA